MILFGRAILVLFTAFAAFVASSLQDKVLCYSDCGHHLAFEPVHAEAGCPAGHQGHGHSDDSESNDCTDLTADFPVTREAMPASLNTHHVEPAILPAVSLLHAAGLPGLPSGASPNRTQPPAPSDLVCLRTIILLV
jgi:hypothetical protein